MSVKNLLQLKADQLVLMVAMVPNTGEFWVVDEGELVEILTANTENFYPQIRKEAVIEGSLFNGYVWLNRWMSTQRNPTDKMAEWVYNISNFDFDDNTTADTNGVMYSWMPASALKPEQLWDVEIEGLGIPWPREKVAEQKAAAPVEPSTRPLWLL